MTVLGAAAVLIALLRFAATQDANCDFSQNMQVGQTYYIYSPGYPNNYTGARQCRWVANAPSGYQVAFQCSVIELPYSQGCSADRLLISRSGDLQLSGADVYCGRGTTSGISTGQRLSFGLITPSNTRGGRFSCQVMAQPSSTTPTCSCGVRKRNRIVGGQETGINEFPMMAAVVEASIASVRCGGTIIDVRYVLTAAHCVVNTAASALVVVVGEHDVTIGDSPATQGIYIDRITMHPQYAPSNYDYDIAVLRLQRDITFSDRVGPVCLPYKFAGADVTGATLTFLGWGTTSPGGPTSNTLQMVDVSVISQSVCRQSYSTLTDRQLCTYSAGKDACQYDSGGPGLYTDSSNGLLYLMGIISYGQFCASRVPGVNARVTTLLSWVENNTPGANYCRK